MQFLSFQTKHFSSSCRKFLFISFQKMQDILITFVILTILSEIATTRFVVEISEPFYFFCYYVLVSHLPLHSHFDFIFTSLITKAEMIPC